MLPVRRLRSYRLSWPCDPFENRRVTAPSPQLGDRFLPGSKFGAYDIVRLIGAGGMGAVYEATHRGLGRRVALKTLHVSYAHDWEVVARLMREGQIAAKIRHPNVVDVSDVWERRMDLARCYASQLGLDGRKGATTNIASPDFERRISARFAYWGARIGARYGEPFLVERVVPVDDPVTTFRKRGPAVL